MGHEPWMALACQYVWFTRAFYALAQAHVELRGLVDVVASKHMISRVVWGVEWYFPTCSGRSLRVRFALIVGSVYGKFVGGSGVCRLELLF